MDIGVIVGIGSFFVTAAGVGFAVYTHFKSKEKKKPGRKWLNSYKGALRKELGRIGIVGPGFETITTPIHETFTSLRISESSRREADFKKKGRLKDAHSEAELFLSPEKVIERAFRKYRLLLIIGDPGSGKTTLLKYYAVTCLDKKQARLGFGKKEIIPLFFPLRELKFSGQQPLSLQENLSAYAEKNYLDISAADFYSCLKNRRTLVLLDGLDEISDKEKRARVCDWVERAWTGLQNACFVLTSRPTGMRKSEGIELVCEHLRGDIMDFSPRQQELFLQRWFRAAFLQPLPPEAGKKERQGLQIEAKDRAETIIEFMKRKENKSIRELAKVPMLLQIMAILWRDRDFLPGSRTELYDISLNYLLEYRDKRKKLLPLLPAARARRVLQPTALWLQEELQSDNASKEKIHAFMAPILKEMRSQPDPQEFCENLRDRAGLIADYGEDYYIFRHRSFLEFLAAGQLLLDCREKPDRIGLLVDSFKEDWWEEALLFFMGEADGVIFDRFMQRFFKSPQSSHIDANKQTLLQNLVREAPQKRIDGLVECLTAEDSSSNQVRYILDCLKTVATPEALSAVKDFMQKAEAEKANLEFAADIVAESAPAPLTLEEVRVAEQLQETPASFRSPFEGNVEYIRIPGGSYKYSLTGKLEKVPDLYFCKYPVTNKRYRRFISYLQGEEKDLEEMLTIKLFAGKLLEFSETVKEYTEYLGKKPGTWQEKLRSRFDDDKKFKGDDQPVVGITWYAARSYCFWLSCLQAAAEGDKVLKNTGKLAALFRLPTEIEWEWAAAGRETDGSLRKYPWPKSRGEPTPELANYNENVGATTPVGRYPAGATPEGLLDMAGNVWEWMNDYYDEEKKYFALRGGCWWDEASSLCCVSRNYGIIHDVWINLIGFRVCCAPQL